MIVFAHESVADVRSEIEPLLAMHWREIAHYQDIPLDPDWDFYLMSPSVRVFTARDGGRLIGYGVFFIGPSRHSKTSVQAVEDILFLHPEYRGGRAGYGLVRYCDDQLKAEGAQVVYQHVNSEHDFGPLLKRCGYELVDHIYGRRLDRE